MCIKLTLVMSANICNTCTRRAGALLDAAGSRWAGQNYRQIRNLRQYQEKTVRLMYYRGRSFDKMKFDKPRRSQFLEWNFRSELYAFSRRLHEQLSEDTLRQVFTHPSYTAELEKTQRKLNLPHINVESNSQLVEAGRQILDDSLRPYLRYTFTRMPEDGIVHIASYLGSDEVLADVAKWIGCKEIILSKEYPPEPATMANTVRALVAAIQANQPDRTQRFVNDIIISYLNDKDLLDDVWIIPNPQQTLKLLLANSQLPAYEPRIMFETGVKTLEPCHVVGLYSNQKLLGSSAGETLEIAEHCAALDALQTLFDLKEHRAPLVYGEASLQINYAQHKREHDYIKTWRFQIESSN